MSVDEVFHSTVHFSGRVQGVGFRYKAMQIAKEFDVSGYVRNMMDGRVELVAEGDREQVQAFVDEVADRLSVYIRRTERSEGQHVSRYKGFLIA